MAYLMAGDGSQPPSCIARRRHTAVVLTWCQAAREAAGCGPSTYEDVPSCRHPMRTVHRVASSRLIRIDR